MLARPATSIDDLPTNALFERKYDGFRALGAVVDGNVALQSRSGGDLSPRFPSVVRDLGRLSGTVVVDGEIIGEDASVSSFGAVAAGAPVRFVAFDLLRLGRDDVRDRPLTERRRLLEQLLEGHERLHLAERVDGPASSALDSARSHRWEGIVAKRPDAPYVGGRQSAWLKARLVASQEVVVVGWRPLAGSRRELGALLVAVAVAVADDGTLRYAGRVGTGFSDADRRVWQTTLEEIELDHPAVAAAPQAPGTRWVQPVVVVEVHLREWTRDGLLRQPSFVRVRPDKAPSECIVEPSPFIFARPRH
jgi:bifunctional non-homologous end joining protein LigD